MTGGYCQYSRTDKFHGRGVRRRVIAYATNGKLQYVRYDEHRGRFAAFPLDDNLSPTDVPFTIGKNWPEFVGIPKEMPDTSCGAETIRLQQLVIKQLLANG